MGIVTTLYELWYSALDVSYDVFRFIFIDPLFSFFDQFSWFTDFKDFVLSLFPNNETLRDAVLYFLEQATIADFIIGVSLTVFAIITIWKWITQ